MQTLDVLEKLVNLFAEHDIDWVLGGHTGLIVQGVDVEDDGEIDICTTEADAYVVENLLDEYMTDPVAPKETDHFKAHWGIFDVDGTTVEIMGDPKIQLENSTWRGMPDENITTTTFRGKKIPVFTLASEYAYYANSARKKKRDRVIANAIKAEMDDGEA